VILQEQHKRRGAEEGEKVKKFSVLLDYLKDADSAARRKELIAIENAGG
jgi:hypothetical protein